MGGIERDAPRAFFEVASPATTAHFELDGDVGVITLDHPPHNTIDARTAAALVHAAEEAAASTARAVVVRANGRIFSSGGDLTMMASFGAGLGSEAAARASDAGGADRKAPPSALRLLRALEEIPVPTIASVHRICVAGGLEIALACDLVVAAKSTLLGLVEADVGLTPFMGGVQRLAARIGAGRAREMVYSGKRYDTATCHAWGLVNRVVPDGALADETMAWARELAAGPTVAHRATKRLVATYLTEGMAAADDRMPHIISPVFRSQDLKAGLRSYIRNGRGRARFTGK